MEFKVGDYVRIKSLEWYEKNKNEDGDVDCKAYYFTKKMTKYCGNIYNVLSVQEDKSVILDSSIWRFIEEMIECIIPKEEFEKNQKIQEKVIEVLPPGYFDFPKEDHTIQNYQEKILKENEIQEKIMGATVPDFDYDIQIYLTPKKEFEQKRLHDIVEAINLCHDNQIKINVEWIEEYNERLERINNENN